MERILRREKLIDEKLVGDVSPQDMLGRSGLIVHLQLNNEQIIEREQALIRTTSF